ncbi:MAG: hypothetical protein SGPRY_002154 [Prymnesium sp.]
MFSIKAEVAVRHDDSADAASLNARLLQAVGNLRADVSGQLSHLPPPAAAALREALGKFNAVCASLANPAVPLPEEKRALAATMLKQVGGFCPPPPYPVPWLLLHAHSSLPP